MCVYAYVCVCGGGGGGVGGIASRRLQPFGIFVCLPPPRNSGLSQAKIPHYSLSSFQMNDANDCK